MAVDDFLAAIGKILEDGENGVSVLDPQRLREMQFAYSVVTDVLATGKARVSYKLNKPLKNMGSISIEGKDLVFPEPEWFSRAAEFADNTEVYPLLNGEVRITFTFHDLTKDIG